MTNKNLKRDQSGIAHLVMVLLIVVVVGIIGLAGYTVMNGSKKASTVTTTTTKSSEQAAVNSSCLETYKDENLCKFADNADIDKLAFKATFTNTDPKGATTNMTMSNDGKGNTSLNATGDGALLNTIQYDKTTYVENDGVWYEYPSSDSSVAETDPTADLNLGLGEGVTYKPLGKEACGSLTCFKYSVAETATPDITQYVWFDVNDYLLRKWESTDADTGKTTMTLDYQAVKISKPSPVKPFSELYQ